MEVQELLIRIEKGILWSIEGRVLELKVKLGRLTYTDRLF